LLRYSSNGRIGDLVLDYQIGCDLSPSRALPPRVGSMYDPPSGETQSYAPMHQRREAAPSRIPSE
jgi:hypothetical protein